MTTAFDRLGALVTEATPSAPAIVRESLDELRARLDGPLRIAIAGRVKAGKSTLLNAMVGERLAPTDAGECTTLVAWFREGLRYDVGAVLRDGRRVELPFSRRDGALHIELAPVSATDVERLDIAWPASVLREVNLIDTPGLASAHDEHSLRTREFLALGEDRPTDADAVIYLMRHLHGRDVAFLDAFLDRSVAGTSPANAVAVLSRADEIGAGRLDAMESAARIAGRYRHDPALRTLCATVVPVAGLLAETGLTFRESEAGALRVLAGSDTAVLARMLLSADELCEAGRSDVPVEVRRALLDRLGMFGVRLAVLAIREGRAATAVDLARLFITTSGLEDLWRVVRSRFVPRARVLKARAGLATLRGIVRTAEATEPAWARRLASETERIEAAALDFAGLRLEHLVLSESVRMTPEERDEVLRLLGDGGGDGTPPMGDAAAALAGIERWRLRGSDPFADPALVLAADTMARLYEAEYAAARTSAPERAGG